MGRAAMPATVAEILHQHPNLSFRFGTDTYSIQSALDGKIWQSIYAVQSGRQSLSFPLLWAFGTGRVGQSYLFKKPDGQFYEARVTYFETLQNLGFTPDRALAGPADLDIAMSRHVPQSEVLRCFNCHSTGASIAGEFDELHLVPGVSCEACHGPGSNHVSAMDVAGTVTHRPVDARIFNPMTLSPTESVEFCGACHGSWWDVKLAGVKGVSTTRSAPYRLVTSKCWGKGDDDRLICTACHDPHKELNKSLTAYDAACLKCHLSRESLTGAKPSSGSRATITANHPGKACPVASQRCPSCHMPKVFVPEMNDNFTDHRIRIAKAGEPFPE
jgi:hypothetical protein